MFVADAVATRDGELEALDRSHTIHGLFRPG